MSLPRGGLQNLALLDADRRTVLATGLWSSRRTQVLTATICGQRSLFVRVAQKGAPGRVAVVVSAP